jgi:Na+-transporting methylmalonyl-CoA/oxaloacetate decarboxylase gamma subunit
LVDKLKDYLMQDDKRNELYEKLYFHEIDARDKVVSRLQIPLALLFSVLSIFAVLMKGVSSAGYEQWHFIFYVPFALSVLLFVASSVYFVGAFYDHEYSFMPPAKEMEDYRNVLITHYEPYEGAKEYVTQAFSDFIYGHFNRCSTANTVVNDLRSRRIHMCNRFLLFTAIPLLLSFLVFNFSGMANENASKLHKVELSSPVSFVYPDTPIKIQGEFNSTTLEIDFSHDIKEIINVRRQEGDTATATATAGN